VCSIVGLGQTVVARGFVHTLAARHRVRPAAAVAGAVEPGKITPELIDAAAAIADISITAEKRTMMLGGLEGLSKSVATIRGLKLPNSVAPPFVFDPEPGEMILE